MQKHKSKFHNPCHQTIGDVQHCLRLNDLDEIDDQTHHLDFYMLGLFSFQHWSLKKTIDFWMDFLTQIDCLPDVVTIHPDRKEEWKTLYEGYPVDIQEDPECVWSDGSIGGYCTEFYKQGVEIGNIVNTLGHSIDCGFGLERLERFVLPSSPPKNGKDVLRQTIELLIEEGVVPSNSKQGYVLRRLIRTGEQRGLILPHLCCQKEYERTKRLQQQKEQVLKKYPNRSSEFYWETFGIRIEE